MEAGCLCLSAGYASPSGRSFVGRRVSIGRESYCAEKPAKKNPAGEPTGGASGWELSRTVTPHARTPDCHKPPEMSVGNPLGKTRPASTQFHCYASKFILCLN